VRALQDEDGQPRKRQRGHRAGQRLAAKATRPLLAPYGGIGLVAGWEVRGLGWSGLASQGQGMCAANS
jgi:hypothetical protein